RVRRWARGCTMPVTTQSWVVTSCRGEVVVIIAISAYLLLGPRSSSSWCGMSLRS
ncbi:hypothetical protein TRAPUB_13519, partial [Trametes pubescens]